MRFHYDKKEDALYLRFDERPYAESDEVEEGIIFDYDRQGRIIGIEVLDASRRFSRDFTALFLKRTIPVTLAMEAGVK